MNQSFEETVALREAEYKQLRRTYTWLDKLLYFVLGIPFGAAIVFKAGDSLTGLWDFIGAELVGAAFTVIVIDSIYESHARELEKNRLVWDLRSATHAVALMAVDKLRFGQWHLDGKLAKSNISGADLHDAPFSGFDLSQVVLANCILVRTKLNNVNLRDADLTDADLTDADASGTNFAGTILNRAILIGVNLEWAVDLTDEQLSTAHSLCGAILSSGVYDGRFCLEGDMAAAKALGLDVNDTHAMAGFYGISEAVYLEGQINAGRPRKLLASS